MFETTKLPTEQRTVTGNTVSFNTHYALPLDACKITFEATQAGSGDPSPSNPRAISGVSAIGLNANSTPVSISLGDTRYGGELDVLTGKLTVYYVVKNLGSMNWYNREASPTVFYSVDIRDTVANNTDQQIFDGMCELFKPVPTAQQVSQSINYSIGIGGDGIVYIRDNDYTSTSDFKSYVSGKYILYKLKTPITVQLSANELSSILGNNTFSTDTGTLEITFSDLQEKSASGSVATFNTALAMPLVNGEFSIEAYQEGSGDPAPDNVRNIVGFDKMRINVVNFNQLINPTKYDNSQTIGGNITYTKNNDGSLTFSGTSETSVNFVILRDNSTSFITNHIYYVGGILNGSRSTYYLMDTDNIKYITSHMIYKSNVATTFLSAFRFRMSEGVPCNTTIKPFIVDLTQAFGEKIANYLYSLPDNGLSIIENLFYKDYYSYNVGGSWVSVAGVNGDDYPDFLTVYFGDTYYGGYYNPVSGKLRLTHAYYQSTSETNCTQYNYSNMHGVSFGCVLVEGLARAAYISNMAKPGSSRLVSNKIWVGVDTGIIYWIGILDDLNMTLEEFNVWIKSHPLQVAYKLATPIEIDDLSEVISTTSGSNIFFCDTGDSSVTYKDCDLAKRGDFRQVFEIPS